MEKHLTPPTHLASAASHHLEVEPEERIIGGYLVVKPLSLRNALVFRVRKPDAEPARTFVLKLTKLESLEYEKKFLEKFRDEPKIIQLIEEVEERGIKGLVLEDFQGIDLQDYLETFPDNRLKEVGFFWFINTLFTIILR